MPIPPQLAKLLKEAPGLVKAYGPELIRWVREHPELVRDIVEQVRPRPRPHPTSEADDMSDASHDVPPAVSPAARDIGETIATLRSQVEYLLDSADDTAERERAIGWQGKIERLERAHALIAPGGSSAERERLANQVERLRASVVAAFLIERIEDEGGPSPSDADR